MGLVHKWVSVPASIWWTIDVGHVLIHWMSQQWRSSNAVLFEWRTISWAILVSKRDRSLIWTHWGYRHDNDAVATAVWICASLRSMWCCWWGHNVWVGWFRRYIPSVWQHILDDHVIDDKCLVIHSRPEWLSLSLQYTMTMMSFPFD